ncbi:MAG: hypothetical protein ABSG53_10560, partial [Thermoguttaceae bacterium]
VQLLPSGDLPRQTSFGQEPIILGITDQIATGLLKFRQSRIDREVLGTTILPVARVRKVGRDNLLCYPVLISPITVQGEIATFDKRAYIQRSEKRVNLAPGGVPGCPYAIMGPTWLYTGDEHGPRRSVLGMRKNADSCSPEFKGALQETHLLLGDQVLVQPIVENENDPLGFVPEKSPAMGL